MTELVPLEELYKYEIQGRALAEGTEYRRLGELMQWLTGLLDMLNILNGFFYNTAKLMALHDPQKGEQLEMITYNLISPFSIVVARIRSAINSRIRSEVADPRMTIDEYFSEFGGMLYVMADDLLRKEVCVQCRLVTNQSCCWASGPYNSPRLLINDITAVFHRIIELYIKFSQEFGEVYALSDKSSYSINVSDIALQTLRVWDQTIHTFNTLHIYDPQDYEALTGFAFDNMVELKVGSAAGHLTKIDLSANRVDYYDTDLPVVRILGKLFEKLGGKYVEYQYDHAVYDVSGVPLECIASIIALATSMDFRYGDMGDTIWHRLYTIRDFRSSWIPNIRAGTVPPEHLRYILESYEMASLCDRVYLAVSVAYSNMVGGYMGSTIDKIRSLKCRDRLADIIDEIWALSEPPFNKAFRLAQAGRIGYKEVVLEAYRLLRSDTPLHDKFIDLVTHLTAEAHSCFVEEYLSGLLTKAISGMEVLDVLTDIWLRLKRNSLDEASPKTLIRTLGHMEYFVSNYLPKFCKGPIMTLCKNGMIQKSPWVSELLELYDMWYYYSGVSPNIREAKTRLTDIINKFVQVIYNNPLARLNFVLTFPLTEGLPLIKDEEILIKIANDLVNLGEWRLVTPPLEIRDLWLQIGESMETLLLAVSKLRSSPEAADIFSNTTDIGYYDEMLRNPEGARRYRKVDVRIVWMTPKEYLQECARMQGTSLQRQYERISRQNIERLKAYIQSGGKLPLPILDYDRKEQEGRHRAVLAEELGIPKIPVVVVRPI